MIDRYSLPEMKKVWSDQNKYTKWLDIEIATCEAWFQAGIIPEKDIVKLRSASYNHQRMEEIFKETKHDVTAFLRSITEYLGAEGRWVHLGLTSSDIMDTALSLQLIEASDLLIGRLVELSDVLKEKAICYKHTPIMGRTHGIHAEPTTFGLKIALWWDEIRRQEERLKAAKLNISVGKISGAVGTHATVPPQIETQVCQQLGLEIAPLSNQIIQRDRHAYLVVTLALIAATLEKFATEIRSLQRTEVREVEEPFAAGQTGSSAMPHKRNPELTERICGLARIIRGYSIASLENVALWHERDISHSSAERIILPDACLALDYMLSVMIYVMKGLKVYPKRMWKNIESTKGIIFSQRMLLSLVEKGISRESAYKIIQSTAMRSWDEELDFRELIRANKDASDKISEAEFDNIFDYSYYSHYVNELYQRIGL